MLAAQKSFSWDSDCALGWVPKPVHKVCLSCIVQKLHASSPTFEVTVTLKGSFSGVVRLAGRLWGF